MKSPKRFFVTLFFSFLLAMTLAAFGLFQFLKTESGSRDIPEGQVVFHLKIGQGMSAKKIASILYNEKIIRNEKVFYLFARFPKAASFITGEPPETFTIRSGVCDLASSMDLAAIYREVSRGRQEERKVSFPEGLTISKIATRLEEAGICASGDFIDAARGKEGFLFPDTYSFAPNSGAQKVAQAMEENFWRHVKEVPALRAIMADKKKFFDTVVLASIIEREYRAEDEAPLIASVFTNRLKNGIGLYSCATVEYVITEVLGRPHPDIITYNDLELDSPYNTYRNSGLPPGPICNPGIVSLKAAGSPAQTDFYYFQLMDEDAGRHVFTKTLSEHVRQGAIFKTKKAVH